MNNFTYSVYDCKNQCMKYGQFQHACSKDFLIQRIQSNPIEYILYTVMVSTRELMKATFEFLNLFNLRSKLQLDLKETFFVFR